MAQALPGTFTGRTDADDIAADVKSAAGTTITDRARILESLCALAAEFTAQQPDPQRVLDWKDPLPPESEALLSRLRRSLRHDVTDPDGA